MIDSFMFPIDGTDWASYFHWSSRILDSMPTKWPSQFEGG